MYLPFASANKEMTMTGLTKMVRHGGSLRRLTGALRALLTLIKRGLRP